MNVYSEPRGQLEVDVLHEIGQRIAAADPLHNVLKLVVDVVSAAVRCDSCFVYVIEANELILRASQNPHKEVIDRLKIRMGQGITGWVAENRKPVAIARNAFNDPRFQSFQELPEDRYEAFLSVPILCRDQLAGVINAQHREAYAYSQREVRLISTIGFLVGPEIESVRVEAQTARLFELAESLQMVEAAKEVLQRNLQIDSDGAGQLLQRESQRRRKSVRDIAESLLLAEEINGSRMRSACS